MKKYISGCCSPLKLALLLPAFLFGLPLLLIASPVKAATPEVPAASKAVKKVDGKYLDAKGDPTYKIGPDGKVDWYTFSGFRGFNGTCDVCHGPDGAGSSFGPDLTQALKSIDFAQFQTIVSGGKQDVNNSPTTCDASIWHR